MNYNKNTLLWIKEHAKDIDNAIQAGPKYFKELWYELQSELGNNCCARFAYFLYNSVDVNIFDCIDIIKPTDYCATFLATPLTSIEIPDGVQVIPNQAFDGCRELETIKLPNSLEVIGYFAFADCDSLQLLELPQSINTISFCSIGSPTRIKIRGLSKEQATEFLNTKVTFEGNNTREQYLDALV